MNSTNVKRGYTDKDLRQVIDYQRSLIAKYGHRSSRTITEAIKILRWAFALLHR